MSHTCLFGLLLLWVPLARLLLTRPGVCGHAVAVHSPSTCLTCLLGLLLLLRVPLAPLACC